MAMEFGAVLGLQDEITNPLRAAGKGLGRFEDQSYKANKAVGLLDKSLGSLVGGLGVITAIGKAFKLGGELGETQNKFNVVFGEMAEDTEMWITQMSDSWNKSELSIKTALATNQDLLTGFGATEEAAAGLSKQFVVAATDLASFSNVPAADAMDRWSKAMLGNHENLTMMGIVLNDVNLTQRAVTMGYKESFRELAPLEKMQVRYAEAMSQTKNSIGDASNTAWEWVNVMQGIKSVTTDITAAIGVGLTSAFVGLGRDALTALKIMKVGQDDARSAGEMLEPVVRNLTKAYVAYKIVQGAVWLNEKRIAAAMVISNAVMSAKRGIAIATTAATLAYSAATMGATGATAVLTGGMAAFNAVLFANPIVAVVAGVVALGAAVVIAYKKSEKFRNVLNSVWETLKNITGLGTVLKGGEALVKFFTGTGEVPGEEQNDNVARKVSENTNNMAKNNNANNSKTEVNVSGNEFVVREEADIEKIADAIANGVEKRQNGNRRR